jgi:hypothetical protein
MTDMPPSVPVGELVSLSAVCVETLMTHMNRQFPLFADCIKFIRWAKLGQFNDLSDAPNQEKTDRIILNYYAIFVLYAELILPLHMHVCCCR